MVSREYPNYGPHSISEDTRERIMTAADTILSRLGQLRDDPDSIRAEVSIDSQAEFVEVSEDALPLILITKPLGKFAKASIYSYGVDYNQTGAGHNTEAFLYKSDPPRGNIRPGVHLLEPQAARLANDLERIAQDQPVGLRK